MEVGLTKGKRAITTYKTIEVFESDKIPTFRFKFISELKNPPDKSAYET